MTWFKRTNQVSSCETGCSVSPPWGGGKKVLRNWLRRTNQVSNCETGCSDAPPLFCSVKCSYVRLCSVMFSYVRLCSLMFGYVRLCSVMVVSLFRVSLLLPMAIASKRRSMCQLDNFPRRWPCQKVASQNDPWGHAGRQAACPACSPPKKK